MVEVLAESGVGGCGRSRESPDHEHSSARERASSLPGQVPKSAFHEVPRHGGSDGLADHEPDLRSLDPGVDVEVEDQGSRADPAPLAHGLGEEPARGEPVPPSQHGAPPRGGLPVNARGGVLRRPGGCDPCDDATPRWRGRRGYASADGNRASCDGDGCSAGTYACSRVCSPVSGVGTRHRSRTGSDGRCCACLFGWHRPPTASSCPPRDEVRLRLPWTCGTGRLRFDRPTVRAAGQQGQTGPSHPPRETADGRARDTLGSLWTTG